MPRLQSYLFFDRNENVEIYKKKDSEYSFKSIRYGRTYIPQVENNVSQRPMTNV